MTADAGRHVSGGVRTRVHVAIVFRDKINVMKYDAVEGVLLEGLHVANVHQYASVEGVGSCYKQGRTHCEADQRGVGKRG